MVIWLTGLPGSGKSALAEALKAARPEFELLALDEMRRTVTPEPTYSEAERETVYRALVYTAHRLSGAGRHVIIDATGHRRAWRALAREIIPEFIEVHLTCPESLCRQREAARSESRATRGAPEGVYQRAAEGWPVPGAGVPYEAPLRPELTIDTSRTGLAEGASAVLKAAGI